MEEELIHFAHLTSQCLLSDKCQLAMSRHLYVFISVHASPEALNLNSSAGLRSGSAVQRLCDLGTSGFTVLWSGFLICHMSFV